MPSEPSPPPPLRLSIDLDRLAANWRWFQDQSGPAACGAAIKADGYGLGARVVLDRLARSGCRDFFVATWAEVAALQPIADGLRVSVLHGVRAEDLPFALSNTAVPVLNSAAQVALWRQAAPGRPCDIMVDTGMNRLGLSVRDGALVEGLNIGTLMSHLACGEDAQHPMNERQRARFAAIDWTARRRSLANSGGVTLGSAYAFDLTRPGIGLYGGTPGPGGQVARIEAQIVQLRDIVAGDSVGYGATFVAAQPMQVAILNLGYADGYRRAFSGGLGGAAGCRVLGRVSMDLTAIDASGRDLAEGDWVEMDFDLAAAASASGLSQYELLTGLGHRYQRNYT